MNDSFYVGNLLENCIANMATKPRDMLIESLHPGNLGQGNDVETFIVKATRYFDAPRISKAMRSILVVGLIDKDLRNRYEATEKEEELLHKK